MFKQQNTLAFANDTSTFVLLLVLPIFFGCLLKCAFLSSNHVYMGQPRVKPRKNIMDKMFEHFMHQTGHDHIWEKTKALNKLYSLCHNLKRKAQINIFISVTHLFLSWYGEMTSIRGQRSHDICGRKRRQKVSRSLSRWDLISYHFASVSYFRSKILEALW